MTDMQSFLWSLRHDPHFFTRAQSVGNRTLILYTEIDSSLTQPQLVVIVPKTVAQLSTTRHKLKRQLKSLLRQQGLPGGKFVIVVRRGTPKRTFQDLATALTDLLRKVQPKNV